MIVRLLACAVMMGSSAWAATPAPSAGGASGEPELRLFQQCVEKSEGSMMVSPFSVYETLRYLLPGAAGETKRQIQAVLPGVGSIRKNWKFLSGKVDPSLLCYTSNRIFIDQTVNLAPDYVKTVGNDYLAKVPFRKNLKQAVRQINSWVEERTEKRIQNLLSPEKVSVNTCVVLVNALYMRARWGSGFDAKETQNRPFYREDGSSGKVPMMKQNVFMGNYYDRNGVRGASLFFKGDKGAPVFMAVLPPKGKNLKQFVAEITAKEWRNTLSSLSTRNESGPEYHLRLPRFVQESPTDSLKDALTALGMKEAFTTQADFTPMWKDHPFPLKVDDICQKNMIKVGEDGLEAVAATAVVMQVFSLSPPSRPGPEIEFNRPFLWIIYSPKDKAVLFAGTYFGPES